MAIPTVSSKINSPRSLSTFAGVPPRVFFFEGFGYGTLDVIDRLKIMFFRVIPRSKEGRSSDIWRRKRRRRVHWKHWSVFEVVENSRAGCIILMQNVDAIPMYSSQSHSLDPRINNFYERLREHFVWVDDTPQPTFRRTSRKKIPGIVTIISCIKIFSLFNFLQSVKTVHTMIFYHLPVLSIFHDNADVRHEIHRRTNFNYDVVRSRNFRI